MEKAAEKRSVLVGYLEETIERFGSYELHVSVGDTEIEESVQILREQLTHAKAMILAYTNCLERIKALNTLD